MTQRPDDTRLHDWLDETVGQTPDPVEGTRQVMSQVEETSQVGRWLPFPVLHRKAKVKPPTTNHTTEYQPSPISDTNGHTPTVIRRTQTMFSPVKAITAGALVFAIGGLFLIAQPFGQQAENAPAAEVGDYAEPVKFTLVFTPTAPSVTPPCEAIRGMTACRGIVSTIPISEVSDPRLVGSMTAVADQYQWPTQPWWETNTFRISNDDGAWQGSFIGVREGGRPLGGASVVLVGERAYEGLYALMDMSDYPSVNGIIFGAPPPDAPVLPPSAGS